MLLERLQIVTDLQGRILDFNIPSTDLADTALSINWKGMGLKDCLGLFQGHWPSLVSVDWLKKPQSLFLPIENNEIAYGMIMDGLKNEDRVFITLSPALSTAHDLREASASDLSEKPVPIAPLFLRLQKAEARLEHYLNHFPGVFFSQRADFSFSYVGPGLDQWIGKLAPLFSKSTSLFLQLIAEKDRAEFLRTLQERSKKKETFSLRYQLQLPSGKALHVLDVRTPQIAPNGIFLGYEGVWLDITRQVIAEDRLRRSAWKDSLAVLTAGLLHDFSNIMAGIYSISELYDSTLEEGHTWKTGLNQIQKSAKEAQGLVRRLLELQKDIDSKKGYFDMKALIESQKDLLKIILPKGTKIDYHLIENEIPVYLDDVRFRQTLLNLAMNSRDAFGGMPGKLEISLKNITEGESLGNGFSSNFKAEKNGCIITFKDSAGGIATEHLTKLFDPFFTTKEAAKGSGLGLYNAELFVESCGGHIGVESKLTEGTAFYLYFPCTDFTEEEEKTETINNAALSERRRIAVYAAEDPGTFQIVEHLRDAGWEVMPCAGTERLKTYLAEAKPKPDAIFLIELGQEKRIEGLVESLRREHPEYPLIGQLLGDKATTPSPKLKGLLDRLIDRDTSSRTTIEALNSLIDSRRSCN